MPVFMAVPVSEALNLVGLDSLNKCRILTQTKTVKTCLTLGWLNAFPVACTLLGLVVNRANVV